MVPSRGHCVTAAQAWRPWIKIKRSRRDNTIYLITSIYSYVSQNVSKIMLFCVSWIDTKNTLFLRKMNTRICFVRMAKSRLESPRGNRWRFSKVVSIAKSEWPGSHPGGVVVYQQVHWDATMGVVGPLLVRQTGIRTERMIKCTSGGRMLFTGKQSVFSRTI